MIATACKISSSASRRRSGGRFLSALSKSPFIEWPRRTSKLDLCHLNLAITALIVISGLTTVQAQDPARRGNLIGGIPLKLSGPPSVRKPFAPRDPWRSIDGETNYAGGLRWRHFWGEILEVQSGGVRIQGHYENLVTGEIGEHEFFVAHFPYQIAEDEALRPWHNFVALESGLYIYETVLGGNHTIRQLDYGKIVSAPIEELQRKAHEAAAIEAIRKGQLDREAKEKQKAAEKKVFQFHLERARKGDFSSQLRLVELYRTGYGTETNLERADYWSAMAKTNVAR